MKKLTVVFVATMVVFGATFLPKYSSAIGPNLIQNPSVETGTTLPHHWSLGGFGTNDRALTWETLPDTTKVLKIAITSHTNGDAKWVFDSVPVESGALYRFADRYQSNVPTYLYVAYTRTDNTMFFEQIATIPSSSGAWANGSQDFTIPVGVTSASVFHVLQSVGELTTDDHFFAQVQTAAENQFSQGIVSITFDDGWASQYDNGRPILSAANMAATFYIISHPMELASYDIFTDPNQHIVTTSNATATTWSEIFVDPSSSVFRFSDTYSAVSTSTVTVDYTAANGTPGTLTLGTLAPGTNAQAAFIINLPALQSATPISISHASTDTLSASNPVLNVYNSGYMTKGQVLGLQSLGHEIGAHTVHHCNLITLPSLALCAYQPAGGSTTPAAQISGSKTALNTIGATPVDTFAYPNGGYNDAIKSLVSGAGITAARSIDPGFNNRYSDKLVLKNQVIDMDVPLSRIQEWVDEAGNNKLWLVLTFHQVNDPALLSSNGEEGGVTPARFQQIVDIIKNKRDAVLNPIMVKTVHDVLPLMASPLPPNQAPTIALNGNATMNLTVGDTFTDPGAIASDLESGNLTAQIVVTGTVNTATAGTYTRTYTVTDAGGLSANTTRTVIVSAVVVTPNQAPVVTLTGAASMTLTVGSTFTDPGATATDSEDGNITANIVRTGTVDTATVGTYTLSYIVRDSQNLVSNTVTRTVVVEAAATVVVYGGGGGGGGGWIYQTPTTTPTVTPNIGGTTNNGQVLGATCTNLLDKNLLRASRKNSVSNVKKLQTFLNSKMGTKLPVTGYFGTMTYNAVKMFQTKHKAEILAPLKLTSPTGAVGVATRAKINALNCEVQ